MIIGLTGPAGSGKDTVADWLESAHDFERIALADPIRRGLCTLLGLSHNLFLPQIKEQVIPWLGKSPRELMQTLGTEWGRNLVASDLWLRVAEREIADSDHGHIVITDIRFEDEAAWLRNLGGVLWYIKRDNVAPVREHVSEAGIEHRIDDYVISNNGTIENLLDTVDAALCSMTEF